MDDLTDISTEDLIAELKRRAVNAGMSLEQFLAWIKERGGET